MLQSQKGCFRGSRLVSSKRTEFPEASTSEAYELEPLSAARCRVFRRSKDKVINWEPKFIHVCNFFLRILVIFL